MHKAYRYRNVEGLSNSDHRVPCEEFQCAVSVSYGGNTKPYWEGRGFLNLYDQLPHELIRLSAGDYADLVAAIETVRYGTDRYREGNNPDCVLPIGPALGVAWTLIEKLKDEVPSTAHDLPFITDPVLQEMIGLDIFAVSTDLQSGEWKGATILAGSCCEALLLYGL